MATIATTTGLTATTTGRGPKLLVLHPGLDDGGTWRRVAKLLEERFTVVTFTRLQYRSSNTGAASIGDEVDEVHALCRAIGEPVIVVGHSSGGVVALEALASRTELFTAGVIYEAPIETPGALIDPSAVAAARRALAAGRPATAVHIFARDIVGLPRPEAKMAHLLTMLWPKLRRLAPGQLADVEAIQALGIRHDTYAQITAPVLLIGGSESPAKLTSRLDRLEGLIPDVTRVTLGGQGHSAQQRAPRLLADAIEHFFDASITTRKEEPC